jgi:hypothetical protein
MQEAPAPAIHPLDSTPEGIIDGNPSSSGTTAGTGMAEVIMLMSLAKSSHESPGGMGTEVVGMPVAEEGMKAVAEGMWVTARMPVHAQGQRQCNAQTRTPKSL